MNKPISILLLAGSLLVSVCDTTAQILKIQGGATRSSLHLNGSWENWFREPIYSPYLVAGLDFLEHKNWNISTGIGYLQKGGKKRIKASDTTDKISVHIPAGEIVAKADYLTMHATFNFKILSDRKLYYYVSAGPRVDLLLSSNEDMKRFFGKDAIKKINVGANLGAGANYSTDKYLIGIKTEYLANFTGVATYSDFSRPAKEKVKDNTFACSIILGMHIR